MTRRKADDRTVFRRRRFDVLHVVDDVTTRRDACGNAQLGGYGDDAVVVGAKRGRTVVADVDVRRVGLATIEEARQESQETHRNDE